jgi:eukaryotic-like serine/threonine-protein kinase
MRALDHLRSALADRYIVERELGQGGMATVYLAHDRKLDRPVAIKVLRPDLGSALGADRFLREIQTTAALRHPNILPLFDSGATDVGPDGLLFYVMPLVEGESLRARLDRERQLPIDDALRITDEVAAALAYAHARGIIHRDIKPENILLENGRAIVADFGIAWAVMTDGGTALTQTGLVLGTPAYMSPEQGMGESALDGRSDQYALGCVLYEMLGGEPPYTGPTAMAIAAKRLLEPVPKIRTLRETVPEHVAAALNRALAKTPADRFADVAGFARALVATEAVAPPKAITPRRRWGGLVPGLAAVVALTVSALWYQRRDQVASFPTIGRTSQVTRDPALELDPALSPDGSMIAYALGTPTKLQVYVQPVAGGRPIALTTDSAGSFRAPVWSPDGRSIAFQGKDGVWVVPSGGGAARRLVQIDTALLPMGSGSMSAVTGLAWSRDGTRLAYTSLESILNLISVAPGGETVRLATPTGPSLPAWSPDGKWVAVSAGNSAFVFGTGYLGNVGNSAIMLIPTAGGPAVRVTDGTSLNQSPQWSPDGRALYWISNRGGNRDVYRVRLSATGTPEGAAERVTTGLDAHSISLAANGSALAYSLFRPYSNIWSFSIPVTGAVTDAATGTPLTTGRQTIESVEVSPDGKWLVFDSDRSGNADLYRMPAVGGEPVRLTSDSGGAYSAVWSRDGRQIAFHTFKDGVRHVFTMIADGTGVVQRTLGRGNQLDPTWSPDGIMLGFMAMDNGQGTLRVMPLSGKDSSRVVATTGDFLRWSPTGPLLAYHATDGIRVVPASGGQSRLLVENAADGGDAFLATWAPDGRTVYYLSRRPAGWEIRSVPAAGGASRALVDFRDPASQPAGYGFSTDGRKFYLTVGSSESDLWVMRLEGHAEDARRSRR